jgi:hypothetical protein
MTTKSFSHFALTQAGWARIQLDAEKVMQARRQESYFEFFETAHIRNRYAIFSVDYGYDFFFQNEKDAAEFALRWA